MQARKFYVDTVNRTFVASPDGTLPAGGLNAFDEDVEAVELYFLEPTGSFAQPYRFLDYSANTVKLAVGITAPAALQTSWTSLATTITASVTSLTNGGGGSNEVQRLNFSGRKPASGGFFLTLPSRTLDTTNLGSIVANTIIFPNHGLLDGQLVTIGEVDSDVGVLTNFNWFVRNRTPSSFQISATQNGNVATGVSSVTDDITTFAVTTPQILPTATAADVQQAFVAAGIAAGGVPQIIVSGSFSAGFTLTFANFLSGINFPTTIVTSTLAAAPGLAANLSFNTNEVAALVAAGTTSDLRLEVEVSDGTLRQTYASTASISNDIITSTSPVPVPSGGTTAVLNFTDGSGGTWALSVDANGIVTTTKL